MSSSAQGTVTNALQGNLQREIGATGHQDQRCANLPDGVRHIEFAMGAARTAAGDPESGYAAIEVVPTEIWQAIFVNVLESYPIGVPFSNAVYDKNRAEVPFRLAAVCRRWRDIAIHASELWTYVASPPPSHWPSRLKGPALKIRLVHLLERSNPRPIDVLFHLSMFTYAFWSWEHLMEPVIEAFPRWRRVKMDIPPQERYEKTWFLQRDAPFLEEAYLRWATPSGTHFPVVPTALSASQALRALHAPASLISPHIALPAISSLGIFLDVAERLALQVIGRMPTLLDLTIAPSVLARSEPPSPLGDIDPVFLLRLRTLTVSGYSESVSALLPLLQAPNLQNLVLKAGVRDGLSDSFIHLLRDKYPAIENLKFDAPVDDGDSYWTITAVIRVALLAFPRLRHLTLSNCHFAMLYAFAGTVWPALKSITLCGRSSYSELDYTSMGTFLGRAVWSAWTHTDRAGDELPHRENFQLFVLDIYPVPLWLPQHLGSLFGPENVHVFDRDGEEIPAAIEDEACFTGDSASSESDSGSSCDSDGPLVTANGPDWVSDEYDDDPSWESESSADY